MRRFKIFAVLLVSAISFTAGAQEIYKNHSFELKTVLGGHLLADKDGFIQDRLYGLDFSYLKDISHDKDNWIKHSHAKTYGLNFIFRDLSHLKGHQDTSVNAFGYAYGLAAQIEFQLLKIGNTTVNFTPAIGISYLTKTYFTDFKNRFIGSHLNETIKADLFVKIPLKSNMNLMAGAGFLHYSNGGFSIPNSGINTLTVFTGLSLNGQSSSSETGKTKSNFTPLQKNSIEIGFGIGRRGVYQEHKGLYKSGMYAGYNYYLNDLLTVKAGFDAVYYYTLYDVSKNVQTFQYYATSYDRWRTGISLGLDVTMWRIVLSGQAGKYLHYNSYFKNIKGYWATGITYALTPHIGIQAKTYMHNLQADYINYGLVFRL